MVEFENCSLNLFSYSVALPTDDSSPPSDTDVFFKIIFFCNGQTFTSPVFNDAASALAWAEIELEEFGTWSVDGNRLIVTDSLCEQGKLYYQVAASPFVYGCTNPAASNYNPLATVDNDTCVFDSAEVVFNIAAKKTRETQIGANIIESDIAKIPALTASAVALNLQVYYYFTLHSDPNLMDNSIAAIVNNFVAACSADLAVYYPVAKIATPPFTKLDWLISTFSPVFVQLDQESQVADATTYIARSHDAMNHIAGTPTVWDTALVYRTNAISLNWNTQLSGETGTDSGRQYIQISDICSFTTDMDYNLTLLNDYFNSLLPLYLTQFLARLPNLDKEVISQWHTEDTGASYISDKPLGNWAIGETIRFILINTEHFSYLFWMTIGNLIKSGVPEPEYYSIKRLVPLFSYQYVVPITLPFTGVTGLGFWNGANGYAMLIDNQTETAQTILPADIGITGKTVAGNFTRSTGWATSWNAANQKEDSISEASVTIRQYSSSIVEFTAT